MPCAPEGIPDATKGQLPRANPNKMSQSHISWLQVGYILLSPSGKKGC